MLLNMYKIRENFNIQTLLIKTEEQKAPLS